MKPVDVLAVMRNSAREAFEAGGNEGPEGNETAYRTWQKACDAIDCVEDLIEVCKEMEARERGYSADPSRVLLPRFRAAIARCKPNAISDSQGLKPE